jgi:hypothetical protein
MYYFLKTCFLEKTYKKKKTTMRINEFISNDPQEVDKEEEPKRSKRAKIPKNYGYEILNNLLKNEPQSFKEAMSTLETLFWKESINNEI